MVDRHDHPGRPHRAEHAGQGDRLSDYVTEFEAYVSAIEAAAPGTPIEGADTASAPDGSFQTAFAASEAAVPKPNIVELTSHYYPLSACCGTAPTIPELLGLTAHNDETSIADEAVAVAAKINVYASALSEVDDQLLTTREGVSGDYEHGTVVECGSAKPLYMYYTPLCAPTADCAPADIYTCKGSGSETWN